MSKCLVIIDVQNDYMSTGKVPCFKAEETKAKVITLGKQFITNNYHVVLVQHVAPKGAPFFEEGTDGDKLCEDLVSAFPEAKVVKKTHASSFIGTNLNTILGELKVTEIYTCGLLTQNCVLFTCLDKEAQKYHPKMVVDCVTSITELVNAIAIGGSSDFVSQITSDKIFN
ncbi:hypothetical protein EIN_160980 [Entamoeba invadens IP1]|uniref:Isochorismatase-like domain-containing protein n=1 Tax=Entamoeba invadens IP1 TaxID=370355 RepID=A0A0A1TYH5_ENTIV|nr:hypothetical protein EIN_160980 [Entamoeba invadens IP1]ELP86544.1 hypothetical protein EIN_160980 [Entamoeba invadens IP1]|eukprot:XP_004185890.1 hypothetical protein EIN_160980 [Entamoeba invadens IP1]